MSDRPPPFDIPDRPRRRYPPEGGVEYEGGTSFSLVPEGGLDGDALDELLAAVLSIDRYVQGDFFDLPAPVYLVHDRALSTSFRAVVRDDRIELRVLPDTDPEALRSLYEALVERSGVAWSVDRSVES